jgi:hypothetical protein
MMNNKVLFSLTAALALFAVSATTTNVFSQDASQESWSSTRGNR